MFEKAIKTSVKDFVIVCTCSFCDSVAFYYTSDQAALFLMLFLFFGQISA